MSKIKNPEQHYKYVNEAQALKMFVDHVNGKPSSYEFHLRFTPEHKAETLEIVKKVRALNKTLKARVNVQCKILSNKRSGLACNTHWSDLYLNDETINYPHTHTLTVKLYKNHQRRNKVKETRPLSSIDLGWATEGLITPKLDEKTIRKNALRERLVTLKNHFSSEMNSILADIEKL